MDVESTAEMEREVLAHAAGADVIVMAAAVADFRPDEQSAEKLKRGAATLHLVPTADILAETATVAPKAFRVGFALETADLLDRAREKLRRKRLDMIVANQVTRTHNPMGSATNQVTLVTPASEIELPAMTKEDVAAALWDRIAPLLPPTR